MIVIAVVVMQRHRGWSWGFFRWRRLIGGLVHQRRDGRLMGAVRVMSMLGARPVLIALCRLGAGAVVISGSIPGARAVVIAMPILGSCPVVTTICARRGMMAVLQAGSDSYRGGQRHDAECAHEH